MLLHAVLLLMLRMLVIVRTGAHRADTVRRHQLVGCIGDCRTDDIVVMTLLLLLLVAHQQLVQVEGGRTVVVGCRIDDSSGRCIPFVHLVRVHEAGNVMQTVVSAGIVLLLVVMRVVLSVVGICCCRYRHVVVQRSGPGRRWRQRRWWQRR